MERFGRIVSAIVVGALILCVWKMASSCSSSEVMLPAGFPFPLGDHIDSLNQRYFWVLDYDTDGDTKTTDLRVWYFLPRGWTPGKLYVTYNPFKVERLRLGVPIETRIDNELINSPDVIEKLINGKYEKEFLR